MEVQELRHGNFVTNTSHNKPLEVDGQSNGAVWFKGKGKPYYSGLENVNPIEITEDWLVQFGFTKETYKMIFDIYTKGELSFCDLLPESFELLNYESAPCQYVHQLQNLYFALTGEELCY